MASKYFRKSTVSDKSEKQLHEEMVENSKIKTEFLEEFAATQEVLADGVLKFQQERGRKANADPLSSGKYSNL